MDLFAGLRSGKALSKCTTDYDCGYVAPICEVVNKVSKCIVRLQTCECVGPSGPAPRRHPPPPPPNSPSGPPLPPLVSFPYPIRRRPPPPLIPRKRRSPVHRKPPAPYRLRRRPPPRRYGRPPQADLLIHNNINS